MPNLIYKKIDYPMPELGDLKHRITIYDRTITAPIDDGGNYGLDFTKRIIVWASIDTMKGDVIFDSVNMDRTISHTMMIRFLPFITQEHWIAYDSDYYDIVRIENIKMHDRYQYLYCNLRGNTAKAVNKA